MRDVRLRVGSSGGSGAASRFGLTNKFVLVNSDLLHQTGEYENDPIWNINSCRTSWTSSRDRHYAARDSTTPYIRDWRRRVRSDDKNATRQIPFPKKERLRWGNGVYRTFEQWPLPQKNREIAFQIRNR